MKKKIAITGGIGSGKSYAIQYLRELGFPAFSCDEIYKDVIKEKEYVERIADIFPDCVDNGHIDRIKLSNIVFVNEEKLKALNTIAHPLVMEKLIAEMDYCEASIVFAEVPLLFEGEFEKLFDEIVILKRDILQRIDSVIKRDGISMEDVYARIENQFNYESVEAQERLKNCRAHIIVNNGSKNDLKNSINALISRL